MGYNKSETLINYIREILEKIRDQKLECSREIINTVLLGSYFLRETFYRELDGKAPPPVYDHILGEIKTILHPKNSDISEREPNSAKPKKKMGGKWNDLDSAFTELDEMWQHQAEMNHRFIHMMREKPTDAHTRSLVEMSGNLGNLLSEIQSRLIAMSHTSISEEMPGFNNLIEELAARFQNERAVEEEFQLDSCDDAMEVFGNGNMDAMPDELPGFNNQLGRTDDISIFGKPGFINEKDELINKLSRIELSSPFVEGVTIFGDGKAYIILDNEAFTQ
jgi:hypothetical protein